MAYITCKNCGCQMSDKSEACPVCGISVGINQKEPDNTSILAQAKKHRGLVLWILLILSLLFPFLGLALYFVYRQKQPSAAKGFLFWAFYGIALWLMFFLILFLDTRLHDKIYFG